MKTETVYLLVRVPPTVRAEFKGACAVRGSTMRDELIRLMKGLTAETLTVAPVETLVDGIKP